MGIRAADDTAEDVVSLMARWKILAIEKDCPRGASSIV
jgi:hypothetical protein